MAAFYAHHFLVNMALGDGGAYLLSVVYCQHAIRAYAEIVPPTLPQLPAPQIDYNDLCSVSC